MATKEAPPTYGDMGWFAFVTHHTVLIIVEKSAHISHNLVWRSLQDWLSYSSSSCHTTLQGTRR